MNNLVFQESILDLGKFMDKQIRVKFSGGRECSGVLKGSVHCKLNCTLAGGLHYNSTLQVRPPVEHCAGRLYRAPAGP